MPRVAVAVSHPIQHFCPLYAKLASHDGLSFRAIFGVRGGAAQYFDKGFGRLVSFGEVLRLEQFDHVFLRDDSEIAAEKAVKRQDVWSQLRAYDPDVVVVYGLKRPTSRWAWLWAIRHRKRTLYVSDSEDRGRDRDLLRSILSWTITPPLFLTISGFLAVGDANRQFYRRRGVPNSRIHDVPFPIDRANLIMRDGGAARAIRVELGLKPGQMMILTVAKLIPRKNHAELIRAVALSGTSPILVFLGSGPEQQNLQRIAEELGVAVRFPGFVEPERLVEWYSAADIYCHPSLVDHHPLAVSEAICCGLPVIVSESIGSHGPTDDVRPGVNGLVYPTGDERALARCLELLCASTETRQRFGARSAEISHERQTLAYEGFVAATHSDQA